MGAEARREAAMEGSEWVIPLATSRVAWGLVGPRSPGLGGLKVELGKAPWGVGVGRGWGQNSWHFGVSHGSGFEFGVSVAEMHWGPLLGGWHGGAEQGRDVGDLAVRGS